jgi:exodeoxyribonuclease VII large subunit
MMAETETNKRNIPSLNALIRSLVEQETLGHPFWVGGYVTRRFNSNAGHLYFDLIDEDYSIGCIVRAAVKNKLGFEISSGMDIEVYGCVRVYERKADIQIEVEQIRLIETQQKIIDTSLLNQLEKAGLWPREKKPMPTIIRRIGLVTSKQSDALHDFEDTYRSEGGTAAVKLSDVRLQGEQAPQVIADAIKRVGKSGDVDVIVLTRGGGRTADLAVFDNLLIAEAICRCAIPVITGIGHQRDHTLADEVADYKAITPTAVASYLARIKPPEQPTPITNTSNRLLYITFAIIVVAVVIILVLLMNHI